MLDSTRAQQRNQVGGGIVTTQRQAERIKGLIEAVKFDANRKCDDFEKYLDSLHGRLVRELTRQVQRHRNIKVQLHIDARYEKLTPRMVQQNGGAEAAAANLTRPNDDDNDIPAVPRPITLLTKLTVIRARRAHRC